MHSGYRGALLSALAEGQSSMQKSDEDQDGNAELAAPFKRRKWKSNEIFLLIEARKHKEIDLRQGQGRKGLWKGVSKTLAEAGFDRSPEQCKTVWFTLVKRYKVQTPLLLWSAEFEVLCP